MASAGKGCPTCSSNFSSNGCISVEAMVLRPLRVVAKFNLASKPIVLQYSFKLCCLSIHPSQKASQLSIYCIYVTTWQTIWPDLLVLFLCSLSPFFSRLLFWGTAIQSLTALVCKNNRSTYLQLYMSTSINLYKQKVPTHHPSTTYTC